MKDFSNELIKACVRVTANKTFNDVHDNVDEVYENVGGSTYRFIITPIFSISSTSVNGIWFEVFKVSKAMDELTPVHCFKFKLPDHANDKGEIVRSWTGAGRYIKLAEFELTYELHQYKGLRDIRSEAIVD